MPSEKEIEKQIHILTGKYIKSNDEEKANAAYALADLARGKVEHCAAVEAAGGIQPLVQLLEKAGSDFAKGQAADALLALTKDEEVARSIKACGGQKALQALADDGSKEAEWGRGLAQKALEQLQQLPAELPTEEECKEVRQHIQVLQDPKADAEKKADAAEALGYMAYGGDPKVQAAVQAEGGLQPLVQLLQEGDARAKREVAFALQHLAEDNKQIAQAIVSCGGRRPLEALAKDKEDETGRDCAQEVLKLLPEASEAEAEAEAGASRRRNRVEVKVKALENGTSDEQCKAAEQLGNWAAASDDKRDEINKFGGCEALVALVVNGGEDAKWHAARALRNLANHAEAKESILKADGIAVLTPLSKHGKGKVKEAASEALNLLSLADTKAKPAPEADAKQR